jgi:hypothetical protein
MRIKNILTAFSTLCIILICSNAKALTSTPVNGNNNDSVQIIQIEKRVADIQQMDIQSMSAAQKHSLKVELKGMLAKAKTYDTEEYHSHGGVYLSIGAVILILIILILIL